MAEYYAVLKKAIGSLDAGSAEARRAVYDKARNALIGQLKAIDPPLAASEISRQRLELEEAIRRVERETTAEAKGARQARPSEAVPVPPQAPETISPSAPPGPSSPQDAASPQDIFRRAIQEAEARGAAAEVPAPARPPVAREAEVAAARPARNWPRQDQRAETGQAGPEVRPVPEYEDDSQPDERPPAPLPEAYAERRGRSRPPRQQQREDYYEQDESPEPETTTRRSRFSTIALPLLILVLVLGVGALAWSQRTVISEILTGFDGGSTEVAAPESVPAPPDAQSKSEDRLADGSAPSSVRVIGDPSVPAPPEVPGSSAAPSDPIGDTIADLPSGMTGASGGTLKATLYEEPLDAAAASAGVTAIDARVTWQFVENGANGAEVSADIEVPDRGMTIRLVIRRNNDPSLPASHLVETVITIPPGFPGTGIRSVPRLVLKPSENERGAPLIGAAAKVADGFFWIALSAAEADVERNLQLLRERPWIDLPMVYENGQRAILTFEKGQQGAEVFENAFAAWSTG